MSRGEQVAPQGVRTTLDRLSVGAKGRIVSVGGHGAFRKRILEMGFVAGREVEVLGKAPLGDPTCYQLLGYVASMRASEAALISVDRLEASPTPAGGQAEQEASEEGTQPAHQAGGDGPAQQAEPESTPPQAAKEPVTPRGGKGPKKTIRVALLGNPNAGKTTIFNYASGLRAHTGNYGGVTVDSRTGYYTLDGYRFEITDLPGTYSLTAYSPEELYVRNHLLEASPDVVIDVLDSNSLARNLYLTLELLEMGQHVVLALNMYDELRQRGDRIDRLRLGGMLGVPTVAPVGRTGEGIEALFRAVIKSYEHQQPIKPEALGHYPAVLQRTVAQIGEDFSRWPQGQLWSPLERSYHALKLVERDKEQETWFRQLDPPPYLQARVQEHIGALEQTVQVDSETYATDARYQYIDHVVGQCLIKGPCPAQQKRKRHLDGIFTHRIWGLPIFFALLWLMFWITFTVGAYPQAWIESLVGWLGGLVETLMPQGPIRDLLVNGIIGGVGSVIVFLPQIMLLFFCIALLEDTGYMARAVFLMDKLMRQFGLHGRSFIPLLMGFGCSVPAIMATRAINDRKVRMATILVNPFVSCSARLTVYVLIIYTFFPRYKATAFLGIYLLGIVLALLMAWLFRRTLFRGEDAPFIMELPPYRLPTLTASLHHMWEKAVQYLKKMGSVILVASIIIWFLGYFPQTTSRDEEFAASVADYGAQVAVRQARGELDTLAAAAALDGYRDSIARLHDELQLQESILGRMGQWVEPAIRPLGFDWRVGVCLLSGAAAKEVVVSTLGVLLQTEAEDENSPQLREQLQRATWGPGSRQGEPLFSIPMALAFLVFVALYMPCIASIAAVRREANGWKWALFAIAYTTLLAYLMAWLAYGVANMVA